MCNSLDRGHMIYFQRFNRDSKISHNHIGLRFNGNEDAWRMNDINMGRSWNDIIYSGVINFAHCEFNLSSYLLNNLNEKQIWCFRTKIAIFPGWDKSLVSNTYLHLFSWTLQKMIKLLLLDLYLLSGSCKRDKGDQLMDDVLFLLIRIWFTF